MSSESAPGELELVRSFVNTLEADAGIDELSTPAALSHWLAEHELLEPRQELTESDRERVVSFREGLRALMLANNGAPLSREAIESLNAAGSGAPLALRFSGDGRAELAPVSDGVGFALARLAAIVSGAMSEGTWPRLKACRADDCQWAFYDRSRNRSGTWCDMADCGNRAKVRRYRERRAGRSS
jgi:predicted RNA-binding Zn ribbon-like protein